MIKIDTQFMTKTAKTRCPLGEGMAQWWERSPPTSVALVRFPDPASHVGWVCCWFSSLLRGFFSRVFRFSSNHKNHHCKLQFDPQMRATGLSALLLVSPSLNKVIHLGPHLPISSISGSNPSPGLVVFLMISDNHGGCHGNTVTYELMVRAVFN